MILEEWASKIRLYRNLLLTFLVLNVFCLITALTLSFFFWTPAFSHTDRFTVLTQKQEGLIQALASVHEFESSERTDFDRGVFTATLASHIKDSGGSFIDSPSESPLGDSLDMQILNLKKSLTDRQMQLSQELRSASESHKQQRFYLMGICALSFFFGIVLPLILLQRLRNQWGRWQKTLESMVDLWLTRWSQSLEKWQDHGARASLSVWLETGLLTLELFGAKSKNWVWQAAAQIARHLNQRLQSLATSGPQDENLSASDAGESATKETA